MIQRIIDLENDKAAKVQENRLLMLKYKNSGQAGSQPIRIMRNDDADRFNSASIDSGVYSNSGIKPPLKIRQNGSVTGRSTSSIGKLEPIKAGAFKSPGARVLSTIEP